MSATKAITFNTLSEFTSVEVEMKVYNKTLGILIGKGMLFNNTELEKIGNRLGQNVSETDIMRSIHKWLHNKKQELGIEIGTYGADYKKIKEDGSVVGSAMSPFKITCFRFNKISIMSSFTPGIEENS